jgi:hypothetical protein
LGLEKAVPPVLWQTRAHQFHSTGEEVLRASEGSLPSLGLLRKAMSVSVNWLPFVEIGAEDSLVASEFIWVYNEMTKGLPGLADQLLIENHDYAGWRLNTERYVEELSTDPNGYPVTDHVPMPALLANGLAGQELVATPFFDPIEDGGDPDIPGWIDASAELHATNGVAAAFPLLPLSTATPDQIKWHAKLLAEAIPPLSSPAGGVALSALLNAEPPRAFDLMDPPYRDTALWPDSRDGKTPGQQEDRRWLHGDYKDAPFLLTYRLYRRLTEIERQ